MTLSTEEKSRIAIQRSILAARIDALEKKGGHGDVVTTAKDLLTSIKQVESSYHSLDSVYVRRILGKVERMNAQTAGIANPEGGAGRRSRPNRSLLRIATF